LRADKVAWLPALRVPSSLLLVSCRPGLFSFHGGHRGAVAQVWLLLSEPYSKLVT
jgi:hypothetical protein